MTRATDATNFVDLLRLRADKHPETTALVFDDGSDSRSPMSYGELDARARAVAAHLHDAEIRPGDRALLLYLPGPDYVVGFLGCLYAGVVAVPLLPPSRPRHLERIHAVAGNADAAVALTDSAVLGEVRTRFGGLDQARALRWETTDGLGTDLADTWRPRAIDPASVAFLQYTSGSTAAPKGVMVGHDNLVANSAAIADVLGVTADDRGVSWLPPYHDMGLIGGVLQPLYSGFSCLLMSPLTFVHRPFRWLEAISGFGGTVSAAPDFAYAECVRRVTDEELAALDLGSWRHALVGAEPVRAQTLDAFAGRFSRAGFRAESFLPCYGLAEATLLVSGTGGAAVPARRTLDRRALARDQVQDGGPAGVEHVGCGRIHPSGRVAIVDPLTRRRLGEHTVGEVWVCGPSVAHGYWADREATGQTFRARLAGDPDHHWLRTGDLGFLDGDELYITGRIKDLIVVRGVNHYPQDVELTAERAHPALPPGRGAAFAVDGGDGEGVVLVHEAAPHDDFTAAIEAVHAAVSRDNGLVLTEVVLVRPGGVPRTSSGKVRRRECRDRYLRGVLPVLARSGARGTPPAGAGPSGQDTTGRVTRIRELAAAALERFPAEIDPARPLVDQGLDSLRAARLQTALRSELGVDSTLTALLDAASVADLAEKAGRDAAVRVSGEDGPRRHRRTGPVPASPGQERLWLLQELGAGPAYHVAGMVRLAGEPDPSLVRRSLELLAERHESLRTGVMPGPDGVLEQRVLERAEIEVPLWRAGDRAECEARIREWAARPFDLAEPPLVRAVLVAVDRAGHGRPGWVLALCAHHIVVDGWSFDVLAREFGRIHAALAAGRAVMLPEVPLQYGDFAAWQHDRASGDGLTDKTAFWREVLAGATPPELAGDTPGPGAAPFAGAALPVRLPAETVAGLRRVANAEGATLFMALAAGFGALLGRWADRTDVLFGTVSAGRDRPELADLVGFLAGILPLRIDLAGDPAFTALVRRVRSVCLDAYAHQDVPLEHVAAVTGAGHDTAGHRPLVRHLLVLQQDRPTLDLGDGPREVVTIPGGAKADLELELLPRPDGGLSGTLVYATDLFDETSARRLLDGLRLLLQGAAAGPDRPLSALPVLDEAAYDQVVRRFSGIGGRPRTEPVTPHWFEAQADLTPDAVAVVDPAGRTLDYAELDRRSSRLAHHLRGLGVGVEDRVAVLLHRGIDLSVAVLAILRIGAIYVPVDPDHPPRRLRHVIDDSAPVLTLTTADLAVRLDAPGLRVLELDRCADEVAAEPSHRPRAAIHPGNAAYILYTSGSTGRPKGAVNTHAGLANRLRWALVRYPLRAGDRVLQKTPIGFDVSVWELLLPLVTGATVLHARPDGHRDPAYLREIIATRQVTICHFVPSMLRAFLDAGVADLAGVRRVLCSGEELPAPLAEEFLARFPGVALHNLYGPTEAAIDVTAHPVTAPVPPRVPIGGPVEGVALYVLDSELRPRPVGVPGHLFIGGVQVARGYHARPGLTAERFVPDPFTAGGRLYATGDRALWLPDGTLRYLGRSDHQIKIRGNRVEPAEIEAALLAHPGIGAAAVVAHPGPDGEPFLAAYLTAAGGTEDTDGPGDAELRSFLREHLPAAMVPAVFRRLEVMPLLPNGKVDRSALPPVASPGGSAATAHLPPRTPTERALAEIWAQVLGVDRVGVRHDFFELGGHSLMAIRVTGRVAAELGVQLPVAHLLGDRPTVEHLAEVVDDLLLRQASAGEVHDVLAMVTRLSDEQVRGRLAELDRP